MPLKNPLKLASEACGCGEITEEEKYRRLDQLLDLYRSQSGNLINALYVAQGVFGYLPQKVIVHVAEQLKLPVIKVTGVATFYSFFSRFPKGKFTIKVCLGTACYVRGGRPLLEKIEHELKLKVGETTEDGLFSLEIVRCVGACALAPVVVVNNVTHRRVKVHKIVEILDSCRQSEIGGSHAAH
jgi:NADH:ubiquinone oxidoreductase subunit E